MLKGIQPSAQKSLGVDTVVNMPPAKRPSPLLDCGASQIARLIKGEISDLAELSSEMFHFTVHTYECMLPALIKLRAL